MAVANTTPSLGDVLVRDGLITQSQLRRALDEQRATSFSIGRVLVDRGYISEAKRNEVLKREFGFEMIDLSGYRLDPILAMRISPEFAQKHHILPVQQDDGVMILAMEDPSDLMVLDFIKNQVGMRLKPYIAPRVDLKQALARVYGGEAEGRIARAKQARPASRLWRFLGPLLYYTLLFLPLAVALIVLFTSDIAQGLMQDLRPFDIGLYTLLGWGVWAIIVFLLKGFFVPEPEQTVE